MSAKRVVIAIASRDFDPTEVAVPWKVLSEAGHSVVFATSDAKPGACDPLMLTGVLFGQIGATRENVVVYQEMLESDAFQNPIRYSAIHASGEDATDLLVLPGGHAQGMRQYLEDADLQAIVATFLTEDLPLGSICHGAVVLARALRPDGSPAIAGRAITGLPKSMEMGAWLLTMPTMGSYFRTYPEYVQDEVRGSLGTEGSFATGPLVPTYGNPFTVRDGNLVTARWPGDAQRFSEELLAMIGGPA